MQRLLYFWLNLGFDFEIAAVAGCGSCLAPFVFSGEVQCCFNAQTVAILCRPIRTPAHIAGIDYVKQQVAHWQAASWLCWVSLALPLP